MSNYMYEVLALIPLGIDFSLEKVASHFGSLSFRSTQLKSQLAKSEGETVSRGFRVWYGDWAIVAWLDDSPTVLVDNQHLMSVIPLPATAELIGTCTKRLSVWSDEDPELSHSDQMTHYTEELRKRFGMLIYDPVNGGWWI